MSNVIIYQPVSSALRVIAPSDKTLLKLSIKEIGVRDVPLGEPFKIIDSSELPPDRDWETG